MNRIMIFMMLLLVISSSVNADLMFDDLNSFNASATVFNLETNIWNTDFVDEVTNVALTMTITPDIGLYSNVSMADLGNISAMGLGVYDWNMTLEQGGEYEVVLNATSNEGFNDSMVFNITANLDVFANIEIESFDTSVIAHEFFNLSTNVTNNGTADKSVSFNVTLTYNNTLFDFINATMYDNVTDLGDGSSMIHYTIDSLLKNQSLDIDFTFNATVNQSSNYSELFVAEANGERAYPEVTVMPIPTYILDITEIYDNQTNIIDIVVDNLNLVIPVNISNLGNQNLADVNITMELNGTIEDVINTYNLGVYGEYEGNFSYLLSEEGLYNITVIAEGFGGAYDIDSEVLNIAFSFTDADGDGYFSTANGGTDNDDNNANVYPGATERCDGVDNDQDGRTDEGCSSGSSGGGGGGRTITYVELTENETIQDLSLYRPFYFKVNGSRQSMTTRSISDDKVIYQIKSLVVPIEATVGQIFKMDLDDDGVFDLRVVVKEIIDTRKATLGFTYIIEPVVEEAFEVEEPVVDEIEPVVDEIGIDEQLTEIDNLTLESEVLPIEEIDNTTLVRVSKPDSKWNLSFILVIMACVAILAYVLEKERGSEKKPGQKKVRIAKEKPKVVSAKRKADMIFRPKAIRKLDRQVKKARKDNLKLEKKIKKIVNS